jgi:hypothetical protein
MLTEENCIKRKSGLASLGSFVLAETFATP